jgi:hypothetical protein
MVKKLLVDHDDDCDVLYVSVGQPANNVLSYEDEDGLIWRQSSAGKWVGVTVPDFECCWADSKAELMRRISDRLQISIESPPREYA